VPGTRASVKDEKQYETLKGQGHVRIEPAARRHHCPEARPGRKVGAYLRARGASD